jgi:hypothetical protein
VLQYVPLGDFDITYIEGEADVARSNFGAIMELEAKYAETPDAKVAQGTVLVEAMWLYLGRPKDSLQTWAANVHRIEPRANGTSANPSPPTVGDG